MDDRSGLTASARPTAIDLYAGAGGLSLGMEQAGFDVVAAAEFDPIHALTHRFNFPRTPVMTRDLGDGSVCATANELSTALSPSTELDAIVGGPPCQGFSAGGVRNEDDERNGLFLRFVDLVVELQPKVFCLENVAGLLEPRFQSLRKEAIRRLTVDGGYEVAGFDNVVNAVAYGVPQTRRRVLVMGSRIGSPPILATPGLTRTTVGDAFDGLPEIARYHQLLSRDDVELRPDDLERMKLTSSVYARRLAGIERGDDDLSYPRSASNSVLTNSLRTLHTSKSVQRFARTDPGKVEKVSRLFRLDMEGQARTLRAGTGMDRGSHTSPRPIHPVKNRVITVREAARLHGYPDWFRFHSTNWHGHRQVGNSVPPPLAAAAGRALFGALGRVEGAKPSESLLLGDAAWLRYDRSKSVDALKKLD